MFHFREGRPLAPSIWSSQFIINHFRIPHWQLGFWLNPLFHNRPYTYLLLRKCKTNTTKSLYPWYSYYSTEVIPRKEVSHPSTFCEGGVARKHRRIQVRIRFKIWHPYLVQMEEAKHFWSCPAEPSKCWGFEPAQRLKNDKGFDSAILHSEKGLVITDTKIKLSWSGKLKLEVARYENWVSRSIEQMQAAIIPSLPKNKKVSPLS